MNIPEIVLGPTGSIAAYKTGDLVRLLKAEGYAVSCVMTQRATRFISPTTLQALSGEKVYTDLWDPEVPPIVHTTLAERAKLILVAPATANIIGKFASGLADDVLSCLLLATRAKIIFAPAMNVHMWQHPSVQRNVTALKRLGIRFVGPEVGKLACGYEAIGHLAEGSEIVRVVRQLVSPGSPSQMGLTTASSRLGASTTKSLPAKKRVKRAAKKVTRKTPKKAAKKSGARRR